MAISIDNPREPMGCGPTKSRLDIELEMRRGPREEIDSTLKWKSAGDIINYLGVDFFITKSGGDAKDSFGAYTKPHVVAEYCDKNGVIHQKEFDFELLKLIKKCEEK